MKTSHIVLALAAAGLGAYLLLRSHGQDCSNPDRFFTWTTTADIERWYAGIAAGFQNPGRPSWYNDAYMARAATWRQCLLSHVGH